MSSVSTISFGQPGSKQERAAAQRVARHFDVPLTILHWSGSADFMAGEIVGRNAFFLLGALIEIGGNAGILAIGVHAGTPYFDCSQAFLSSLQIVVDGYCDGRVRLAAPFIEWSKQQVFAFCESEGVPMELTYSCEKGTDQPCGECCRAGTGGHWMLCRTSTILHKDSEVSKTTPLLIPSFSSKGFARSKKDGKSEIGKILAMAGEFLTEVFLISAMTSSMSTCRTRQICHARPK